MSIEYFMYLSPLYKVLCYDSFVSEPYYLNRFSPFIFLISNEQTKYMYKIHTVSSHNCYVFRWGHWNKKLTPLKKNLHLASQTVSTHSNQATDHRVQEQVRLPCDRKSSKPHHSSLFYSSWSQSQGSLLFSMLKGNIANKMANLTPSVK